MKISPISFRDGAHKMWKEMKNPLFILTTVSDGLVNLISFAIVARFFRIDIFSNKHPEADLYLILKFAGLFLIIKLFLSIPEQCLLAFLKGLFDLKKSN